MLSYIIANYRKQQNTMTLNMILYYPNTKSITQSLLLQSNSLLTALPLLPDLSHHTEHMYHCEILEDNLTTCPLLLFLG